MSQKNILLVEDDAEIGELLCEYLAQHQFDVVHQTTAQSGLAYLDTHKPVASAMILDIMLPDGDGFDVCKQIRASGKHYQDIPIIMLTAKGDAMDKIVGLEIGADDYLAKPFEPRELVARLKAILRRQTATKENTLDTNQQANKVLHFGTLVINENTREATLAGQLCHITGYQFDILVALAKRAGMVTSRDQLMNVLKQQHYDVFDRSIDVHISRIRAIIEADSKNPKRIITVRGAGYLFASEQA